MPNRNHVAWEYLTISSDGTTLARAMAPTMAVAIDRAWHKAEDDPEARVLVRMVAGLEAGTWTFMERPVQSPVVAGG